ncbi:MAG TPA: DUF1707 domain-containing protein [Streptosporangiaceae bacterium]|jgi:hypothetical protein|nr:DUF1707 domain-containing protein [Streptosporangiaceae bacterium]
MSTEHNIRVSDADRDAVAAQLREHYAQGRLSLDELNERLDRVFASRTNLELASVTADLPYAAPRGVLPSDGVRSGGSQQWASGNRYRGGRGGNGQGWGGPAWNGPGSRGGDHGSGRRRGAGSVLGIFPLVLMFFCLIVLLGAMGFGLGSGPSLVVILLGALAVLRRLLGLGRRRSMPARRRGGRRW